MLCLRWGMPCPKGAGGAAGVMSAGRAAWREHPASTAPLRLALSLLCNLMLVPQFPHLWQRISQYFQGVTWGDMSRHVEQGLAWGRQEGSASLGLLDPEPSGATAGAWARCSHEAHALLGESLSRASAPWPLVGINEDLPTTQTGCLRGRCSQTESATTLAAGRDPGGKPRAGQP